MIGLLTFLFGLFAIRGFAFQVNNVIILLAFAIPLIVWL